METGWLSKQEIAELIMARGSSEPLRVIVQKVQRDIESGAYELTREVAGRGRYGKRLEVHITCLPDDLRRVYDERHASAPAEPPKVFNPLDYPQWATDEMQRRLDILYAWDIRLAETPHKQRRQMLDEFAAEHGVTASTLYRWQKTLREKGEAGLMPDYPQRRDDRKLMTNEIKGLVRQWWLSPNHRTVKTVYELLEDYCGKNGLLAPCYGTVAAYCRSLSKSEQVYHRTGSTAWRSKHEPVARRDAAELRTNELVCGDHRQLDILCKHPTTVRTRAGLRTVWKVAAPWLTVWLDLHSWCFTGWCLAWSPSSQTIALALRDHIINYGVPEAVYVDCGKDYRSMYLSNKQMHVRELGRILPSVDLREFAAANRIQVNPEGLLDALDIEKRHAIPVNKKDAFKGGVPRAKPVESAFNWFRAMEQELPGWRGNKPGNMPETTRNLISGQIDESSPLPTFAEVEAFVGQSIAEHNARPHGERTRPAQAYFDDPAIVRLPASQHDALHILLWPSKPVTVTNSTVYLNNVPYMSPELAKWGGEKLTVRWDPRNIERVVVMTVGRPSSFVAVAENQKMRRMSWHPTEEEYKELVVKPKKQAKTVMEGLQDAYETLHMDDAKLLERGHQAALPAFPFPDAPDDHPPAPPTGPKGGQRTPKAPPKTPSLQGDRKTYVLQEYREQKQAVVGAQNVADGDVRATTQQRITKILPKQYHDAAKAVAKADRNDATRQQVEEVRKNALKYINGKWVVNG